MIVLVLDTETTGLAETKIINPDTLNLWPHIVQLSYVLYDVDKNVLLDIHDSIIKVKEGITISEESSKIHGITKDISSMSGIEIELVFAELFYQLKRVDVIVGHNVSFDINIIMVELLRLIYSKNEKIPESELISYKHYLHFITNAKNICCTMKMAKDICKIKTISKLGNEYIKFPKLIETHQYLFNETPNNLHNSLNDIFVTLRCFCKMSYNIDLYEKSNEFKKFANKIGIL